MGKKKISVLWLANIPSPYSVDFFNELGKQCDLTVLFERNHASDRDVSWKNTKFAYFKGIVLKGIKYGADKALCPGVCFYLSKDYDVIVLSNMATLSGMLSFFFLRLIKKTYLIQGDGGIPKDGVGLKEKLKKSIIGHADLCLSTGNMHDEYYVFYGADKNVLRRIPFSSLYNKDIDENPADNKEKQMLRNKLNLKGTQIVLSIGQFIYRKGFDLLLEAASELRETAFYIVGGTPTTEYQKIVKERHLENVTFLPFQAHDVLTEYYRAADLFVLPTREDIWGLVINEAMAHGLPVITTDHCVAGLELIENGENGYVIPVNDVREIICAVEKIFEKNLYQMGKKSIDTVRNTTFEAIAEAHYNIFEEYVGDLI